MCQGLAELTATLSRVHRNLLGYQIALINQVLRYRGAKILAVGCILMEPVMEMYLCSIYDDRAHHARTESIPCGKSPGVRVQITDLPSNVLQSSRLMCMTGPLYTCLAFTK